jgi:hypothetical protein
VGIPVPVQHISLTTTPVYVLEDEYLVSTGHGLEDPGLPIFEICCMCLPQLGD